MIKSLFTNSNYNNKRSYYPFTYCLQKATGFLNEKDVIPSGRQAARKKKSKYSQKEWNRPRISSSKLPVSLTE